MKTMVGAFLIMALSISTCPAESPTPEKTAAKCFDTLIVLVRLDLTSLIGQREIIREHVTTNDGGGFFQPRPRLNQQKPATCNGVCGAPQRDRTTPRSSGIREICLST